MSRASEKAAKETNQTPDVVEDQDQDQNQIQDQEQKQEASKKAVKSYTVKVKGNPTYCGIGAGGVQFANGQAVITSDRMAAWFREHDGYEVK